MKPMDDNENKKNNETLENVGGGIDEALPDEVLENVAGGGFKDWLNDLFICQRCHDPEKKTKQYSSGSYCDDGAKELGLR